MPDDVVSVPAVREVLAASLRVGLAPTHQVSSRGLCFLRLVSEPSRELLFSINDVLSLASAAESCDDDPGWDVRQSNGGFDLVPSLSPATVPADPVDLEVAVRYRCGLSPSRLRKNGDSCC